MSFNTVKLQHRKLFAACRRMASLAHSFTFQLVFLCHHAGKQIRQTSSANAFYIYTIMCLFWRTKRGSITLGCFRKILAQVLIFCWCYLMFSGFTFVSFTLNLLCTSAERIFHCQSGFHFPPKENKISIRNLRNVMQLIIYIGGRAFQKYSAANKTINLVSVISLTVNVLSVEVLTGSK